MTPLQVALERLQFSRRYTSRLLADFPADDWYRMPAGGVTHVAWQVGHIAVAQYRLILVRGRGERPGDESFAPADLVKRFRAGSQPEPDRSKNPSVEELRLFLDGVCQQAMREAAEFPESLLAETSLPQHPMFETKLEAIFWCGSHELVHAGQIALLKRLLGHSPQW